MNENSYSLFQLIAEHFDANPHENGEGHLTMQVKCPCHDDRTPSLSITLKDEKLLINCFGSCDNKESQPLARST